MIKKILFIALGFVSSSLFAQEGTSSPYSYYGVGEQKFKGINEIKDMGGMAVYTDSLRINTLNPASYGELQRVTISMGASMKQTTLQDATAKHKENIGSIDYLALAIPVGKIGIAAGVMPYTFSGYKISEIYTQNNIEYRNRNVAKGGINRAFIGAGYNIWKNFSIGAEMGFYFGSIEKNQFKFIQNDGDEFPVQYGTARETNDRYSGFSYNFSAQYKYHLGKKKFLYTNATFSPQVSLNVKGSVNLQLVNEQYDLIQTENIENVDVKTTLPQHYSIGLGIGNPFKWFLGAEFTQRKTSVWNNDFLYSNAKYQDAYKVAIGGFYTPKYNSFTSFLNRVTYRAGLRYENTGLIINDTNIEEKAVHAGVGLPVGRFASNVNIGLEYGMRGTVKNNLVKENYISMSIGISLNDRWFEKRKFE